MATLLIPTDFSDNSLQAAVYGVKLLGDKTSKIDFLHTFEGMSAGAGSMLSLREEILKDSQNLLKEFQEKLAEQVDLSDKQIKRFCEEGELPYVLDNLEEIEHVDLIIMGTQGASGLKEVFMGSNTSDVIAKVEMPLLAVPENVAFKAPKKIMIADDGDGCGEGTFRIARVIARKYDCEVHFVHVTDSDPGTIRDHSYDEEADAFEDISTEFHVVESDDVDEALNNFVEQHDIDIMVMVHRHLGLFDRLFQRSASKKMAMHSHVPLLVLQDQ
jgi:nucleotide-binding universal stress UspA family protein